MDFFNRYKKIFLVLGFVGVVIFIGYFLYSLFFKSTTPEGLEGDQNATSTGPGSGLPAANTGTGGQIIDNGGKTDGLSGAATTSAGTAKQPDQIASGGVTKTETLTKTPSLGATISSDGNGLQYYDKNDGKFYRIDPAGNAKAISDKVFYKVDSVVWSPNKNQAVLEYPDGSNIIYDFNNQKQITLPAHWKNFSYSPDGGNLVFKSMGQDPDNRWVATVSSDGSQVRGIEQLGDKDDEVYTEWSPNNQVAALYAEGKDFDRQEVYFIGLNGENFKSTIVEGRGFDPKWSPQGNQLVYSVYSSQTEMKPGLWVVDAQGDNIGSNRRNLNINTWAEKCNFSGGTNLFCAVPRELDEGAGLFPELAKNTVDDLYQIDSATGAKKRIAIPEGDYTIDNIMVSADQKYLYFSDSASGQLHKINLK
ncbi:hypothetical protein HGA34_02160 [Candidatus Falkowbacteria bacterium]|nr:hypothetical protein [Candidatus Falkowbacteria bacterium]